MHIQFSTDKKLLSYASNPNCEFAACAKEQSANVRLDVWPDMPHDFQAFGDIIPESQEALRRIGEVVQEYTA